MNDIETLTEEERQALTYEADYSESLANKGLDEFVMGVRKALRIIDRQSARIAELEAALALMQRERDEARRGWNDVTALSVAAESELRTLRDRAKRGR